MKNCIFQAKRDRFYYSAELQDEIDDAAIVIGEEELIDVYKRDDSEYVKWFDDNISDHFPVRISLSLQ